MIQTNTDHRNSALSLSHSLVVTTIGTRILTDVQSTLNLRKQTTGALETDLTYILQNCNKVGTQDQLVDMYLAET